MNEFVQLWVYLSSTPLFGLTATLVVYLLAQALYVRAGQAAWANPVLWSVVALAAGLTATGTAYPTYFSGAQFIHFLLGPAVVALAWPLWQRRAVLRAHGTRFVIAALAGGTAAAVSAAARPTPSRCVASATSSSTAPAQSEPRSSAASSAWGAATGAWATGAPASSIIAANSMESMLTTRVGPELSAP